MSNEITKVFNKYDDNQIIINIYLCYLLLMHLFFFFFSRFYESNLFILNSKNNAHEQFKIMIFNILDYYHIFHHAIFFLNICFYYKFFTKYWQFHICLH